MALEPHQGTTSELSSFFPTLLLDCLLDSPKGQKTPGWLSAAAGEGIPLIGLGRLAL